MTIPAEADRWRSASDAQETCVELNHRRTRVRDSKNPTGPVLDVDAERLLSAAREGWLG